MKNMTNKFSVVMLAMAAMSVSMSALAGDTVRVVITKDPVVNSQNAVSNLNRVAAAPVTPAATCVPTPNGEGEWCIGSTASGVMRSQALTSSASPMQIVSLPSYGYTAEEVAQHLNAHGNVGYVEADLEVSTREDMVTSEGGVSSSATNDPTYSTYQHYYFESADVTPSGSNIVGLWDAAGMANITQQEANSPDVLVFDSEFFTNSEVPYYSGRNFSTTVLTSGGEPQKHSDDFRPPVTCPNYPSSHGLNVSSIIAAKINNATGIAGVTNNVKIHAIKALTCGMGFLSDVADGLWWASGVAYQGVTPYAGKPGVINMSISAPIAETDACPAYLQTAIDAVTAKGFVVVNSAGNYGSNTVGYVPAKCNNVITVGAVDRTGDKAGFSNYGDEVDIVAQGDEMAVICEYGACYGEGTSFSAPLVSAALAVTQNVSKVTPAELGAALSISARTDTWGSTCASGVCGAGIMDASKLYQVAKAVGAGTANRLEHVLANKEVCEQKWYIDHFGHAARLSEMYKLTMMDGITKEYVIYRLYSVPKGDTMGENAQLEGEFNTGTVMLHGLIPSTRDYAIKVCQKGDCNDWLAVDSKRAQKPAACN
ncbi:S8 family serine peptidase [Shewanella sp. SM23]|uniref:S8 family serine peptidase n=1 Tax=Shewanella sp. SM23 TaxID=2912794 RepID=UPI0021DAE4FB|nr:S8 family serine peptidase [Shewanella sp. SM23]MCU8084258.1 S8 family serine peptidase [Shewanella sp. SM23]